MNKHWRSTESQQRRQFAWALVLTVAGFTPMFVIAAGTPRIEPIPNAPLEVQARPVVTPVAVVEELHR